MADCNVLSPYVRTSICLFLNILMSHSYSGAQSRPLLPWFPFCRVEVPLYAPFEPKRIDNLFLAYSWGSFNPKLNPKPKPKPFSFLGYSVLRSMRISQLKVMDRSKLYFNTSTGFRVRVSAPSRRVQGEEIVEGPVVLWWGPLA